MFKSQKQFFFLAVSIQLMLIWLLLFWLGRFNFSAFTLDTFVSIVRNAFRIDISSICYMLFFPFLLSVLYRIIGGRAWGSLFKIHFYVVSVFVVLLNAVDVCLYQEWGAKINARIFLYVQHPSEVISSASLQHYFIFVWIVLSSTWLVYFLFNKLKVKHCFDEHSGKGVF